MTESATSKQVTYILSLVRNAAWCQNLTPAQRDAIGCPASGNLEKWLKGRSKGTASAIIEALKAA